MNSHTKVQQFSESTVRQVRLDCNRAMLKGHFCTERSEIFQIRCVDNQPETSSSYGNQLWFFEGIGVDELDRRHGVYGVIEYSTQYGLNELVEDGVFTTESQRQKFRWLYDREVQRPDWRQPAHRYLAFGVIAVSAIWLSYLVVRSIVS